MTKSSVSRPNSFVTRHIGIDESAEARMLATLEYPSREALIDNALPSVIRSDRALDLPAASTEYEVARALDAMARENRQNVSLIGMGYYATVTPEVIRRNVLENPAWYTAYTPYQAEVSQGRLEALINFQQMVINLTGMEIANASLLDEATAAAEAMAMARRLAKSKSNVFVVDADTHPQTIAVIATRAKPLGIEVRLEPVASFGEMPEFFACLVQTPGSSGRLVDGLGGVAERAHALDALCIVASDLMALIVVEPPGNEGADIVVGSAQRFGVPMGYGGPHAAFLATRDAFKRSTPGRIIGASIDVDGRLAYRMALQTREQHIRREKATSNICTAQVLLAVVASCYAVYHGPDGLRGIARDIHQRTRELAWLLPSLGCRVQNDTFFDTLTVELPVRADTVVTMLGNQGINVRIVDETTIGMALDETIDEPLLARIGGAIADALGEEVVPGDLGADENELPVGIPSALEREQPFLTHPTFHRYRSETEMLRYLRRLSDKDLALDRTMIPLGSCTMKLNATTEMVPITNPGFANIHPFAPPDQAQGYRRLITDLEVMLAECTGFDSVSLQPNAGSQGEYAGLLAIRRYHEANREPHRDVCLIPASAHGTNPASAQMAGLQVKVVKCDDDGNVDIEDLRRCCAAAAGSLAALMITYPSTHGVFETAIKDICGIVHEHGGQVYMDGANLNALLGLSLPAEIGADVSHINLHKTFCIPHGGGGPGMGPIGVKRHLAPYLPGHPLIDPITGVDLITRGDPIAGGGPVTGSARGAGFEQADGSQWTVSAAPWGSAGILPISWAYIALMGAEGLREATEIAILSANYIANRLAPHYPVLYSGESGLVAHECIIDLRHFKQIGVSVDDVAKRLIDYGFHAPTMSFPVADTLMIEPTESESLAEIDRFCDAMIAIRVEIGAVERGEIANEDSPLTHAPHPAQLLAEGEWDRPYSQAQAFFPAGPMTDGPVGKYWPPVARVDNVHGDRNLVCSCPPISAYEDSRN